MSGEHRVLIIKNSGNGFEHFQNLTLPGEAVFFGLADNLEILLVTTVTGGHQVLICTQGADGRYELASEIPNLFFIERLIVGENHFAFCDQGGTLKIFNRSDFSLLQEIQSSASIINAISSSSDFSTLAAGGQDQQVRVYSHDGGVFTLEEILNFNFSASLVKVLGENIVVGGYSGEIVMFERQGNASHQINTLQTFQAAIWEMYVSSDLSRFGLGENGSFNLYEQNDNSSYDLALNYSINESVEEVATDET